MIFEERIIIELTELVKAMKKNNSVLANIDGTLKELIRAIKEKASDRNE